VVRTAGLRQEQVHLLPWSELQSSHIPGPSASGNGDPLVRVRLKSGRILVFDHQHGEAPQNWAALNRFLQRGSLPTAADAEPAAKIEPWPAPWPIN